MYERFSLSCIASRLCGNKYIRCSHNTFCRRNADNDLFWLCHTWYRCCQKYPEICIPVGKKIVSSLSQFPDLSVSIFDRKIFFILMKQVSVPSKMETDFDRKILRVSSCFFSLLCCGGCGCCCCRRRRRRRRFGRSSSNFFFFELLKKGCRPNCCGSRLLSSC